jgi:hypothetical protein
MGLVMNSPPHTWYALIPSDCVDAAPAGGSPSKSAFSRQAYISESLPPEALEVIHLGAVHLGVLPHLPIHPEGIPLQIMDDSFMASSSG